MNELRNFNEIFRKDVTYDNIKSHKKAGLHPLFTFLEKLQGRGGVKLPPSLLKVKKHEFMYSEYVGLFR